MSFGPRRTVFLCASMLSLFPAAAREFPEQPITQPVDAETSVAFGAPVKASHAVTRVTGAAARPGSHPVIISPVSSAGVQGLNVPGAAAITGDHLLQNERISVAVSDAGHPNGNALSGGYIIDAFLNDRPADSLGQLHLYLDNTYPRMAKFATVRQVRDASTTDSVKIVAEGVDSQDPGIKVWQTYSLRKNSNVVDIETGVTPTEEPLDDFQIGDAFAWGSTQQFLPGNGFESSGKFFKAPWVGGLGRGIAYGYFAEGGGEMTGPMGSTWIDTNVTTGSAKVGETITSRRRFVVARDLAEVYRAFLDEAGTPYQVVRGTVSEDESGRPAAGVRIHITGADGTSTTQAISDEEGRFTAWLPEGSYKLTPSDVIRTPVTAPAVVNVADADPADLEFKVASPAVASFFITDENGGAVPSKVRFFGIDGTPDPDLGPIHQSKTRNVVYLADGVERVAMPAGDYNIIASRGIEYHTTSATVSLRRNRETSIALELKRAFEPKGMVGGDFHLHMKNSFDSAVPLADRVVSSVGEGLHFIVATDHNYVTDLEPVIRKLGLEDWVKSAVGNEITTREHFFGHYNVFPLEPKPGLPGNGATPYEKVTAEQLMRSALLGATSVPQPHSWNNDPAVERVLQVNHPRSGDIGYFDRLALDPNDATTTHPNWSDKFTAIEVFNGKRTDQFEEVFRDWANLLNLGYTFTATGNSDSHKIFDAEAGYPRNYVSVGKDWNGRVRDLPVQAVVEAVNTRHSVLVTNGPFVTFTSRRGAPVGSMETKKSGKVEFDVKVEGADFVQPSSITFYGNGKELKRVEFAETPESLKWQGSFDDEPTTDTWYTVVVRGSRSMFPVVNPMIEGRTTLEAVPLAFTNPIWVDRDGDGRFAAINREKFPMMHKDRGEEALRRLNELTTQSKQRKLPRKKAAAGES